jgi:2-keto-3-deoxy-L-rhamnonate aldolase RhmA
MRFTVSEEQVIVQHILDLDVQAFPPRLAAIKDMAHALLAARHYEPVGQRWLHHFVKRQPDLTVKFNQKYNYKRALCEDPEIIQG